MLSPGNSATILARECLQLVEPVLDHDEGGIRQRVRALLRTGNRAAARRSEAAVTCSPRRLLASSAAPSWG
jgi:hypothetical protein